ncbi:MAG TPA: hypothetical protein VID94_00210 [Acidimicrobiales bacterium]|jgi:hypothetical protein
MGLFDRKPTDEQEAALRTTLDGLKDQIASLEVAIKHRSKESELVVEANALRESIAKLNIDKDRIVEANAREKREVTHMVGLERKRQEFEAEEARKGIERAREEAVLDVRQENLKAERDAFQKEMDFREQRFTAEVGYLKDLMAQILERLPTVTVDRQITDKTTTSK